MMEVRERRKMDKCSGKMGVIKLVMLEYKCNKSSLDMSSSSGHMNMKHEMFIDLYEGD